MWCIVGALVGIGRLCCISDCVGGVVCGVGWWLVGGRCAGCGYWCWGVIVVVDVGVLFL